MRVLPQFPPPPPEQREGLGLPLRPQLKSSPPEHLGLDRQPEKPAPSPVLRRLEPTAGRHQNPAPPLSKIGLLFGPLPPLIRPLHPRDKTKPPTAPLLGRIAPHAPCSKFLVAEFGLQASNGPLGTFRAGKVCPFHPAPGTGVGKRPWPSGSVAEVHPCPPKRGLSEPLFLGGPWFAPSRPVVAP